MFQSSHPATPSSNTAPHTATMMAGGRQTISARIQLASLILASSVMPLRRFCARRVFPLGTIAAPPPTTAATVAESTTRQVAVSSSSFQFQVPIYRRRRWRRDYEITINLLTGAHITFPGKVRRCSAHVGLLVAYDDDATGCYT